MTDSAIAGSIIGALRESCPSSGGSNGFRFPGMRVLTFRRLAVSNMPLILRCRSWVTGLPRSTSLAQR